MPIDSTSGFASHSQLLFRNKRPEELAMSATTPQIGLPQPRYESTLIAMLWTVFIVVCGIYAVFAFDYFISFAAGRDSLWLRLMATLVSEPFAYGPGSVHADQHEAYTEALRFMLMHTTTAAIALALGPFQFITAIRQRVPALHRAMGKIYLMAMLLSTFGNMGYLWMTSFERVYSGGPFAVGLWGLDLMVLLTGGLAYAAIRQRDIPRHRAWMAYNFSLLLTAPVLRILWVLYGLGMPELTQAEGNLAITTYLLPLCAMVGLLWLSFEKISAGRAP
jgi:uncharacterized membrane protein